MADRIFVIYAKTLGTATARPVLEYYTEDETHVPDIVQLGYTLAAAGFAVIESLDLLAPASGENRNKLTIDPATAATTATAVPRYDILRDQTEVLGRVADLIAEWNWTQELDAKITKATQADFAGWIEQLEAVSTDPLWATNPKGIALPPVPEVTTSAQTVGQQVASATWTETGAIFAQKLGLSNWDSLQPVWGFDTSDFSSFVIGPSPTPTATLSWVTGRSGARAMRVTTNTGGAIAQVDTLGILAFATSPGEALVVEGWMRASHSGTAVSLGLGGFANRFTSIPEQAGTSGAMSVGTSWQFFSAIVNVPAGTTRWACGRFRTEAVFNQTRWVEIDGMTIKRLSRLPSAHVQSRTSLDISSTQADFSAAQIALSLNFTRNAASIIRLDAAAALLVPSNAPGDQLNAVFWLTKVPVGGPETVLASWVEQGAGNLLSRATRFTITDTETPDTTGVLYYLRVSKQGSTATVRLGDRSLNAMMLPRI